ncbi:methyltransferase domain-containing protein [Chloroflexota bacterium]
MLEGQSLRENPVCPYGDFPWQKYYWRRSSVVPQYESDYWDEAVDPDGNTRYLLEERDYHIETMKDEIAFVNSLNPGRVLDLGCGPGFFLSALSDDWEKYGMDISERAASHERKYGTIFMGELSKAEYKAVFFDAIMMYHVIEHLEEPVTYVKEVKRILKRGGHFIVATPDFDSGCARRFGSNYRMLHDKGHISLFTSFSLIKLLEDTGFSILKVEYPFFNTRWFTRENLLRLLDVENVSPPFYGNLVTVYAVND